MTNSDTKTGVALPGGAASSTAWLVAGAKILLGTILLTVAAKIVVPVWPVPVTLQSFAVAVLAASYGWRLSAMTVLAYLVEGALGLPVFATGGGLAYLVGPTGGFLLGFLPMAIAIGWLAKSSAGKRFPLMLGGMLAADALLFSIGFGWLVALSGQADWVDQANVAGSAFARGVQPFLIWDGLKMLLAAVTVLLIRQTIRR